MKRRSLLKLGVGTAAALAVAGAGMALLRPGIARGRLAPAGREVFEATARAVLDGMLPSEAQPRAAALRAHLSRLDETIAGFPSATRDELAQLLAVLASAPGRIALAALRPAWAEASVAEVQQVLEGMRTASLTLRQQAYHALRDLTNAAYFADASAWPALGYTGPRDL
jgi:hypothetical protein